MVKLIDIANAAGVSKAAVSYAFSADAGKRAKLSSETRERILRTAKAFHYTPNILGRGFSMGKSFAVALLLPQHCTRNISKHNLGMFHGVSSVLAASDYNLLIFFGCQDRFLDSLEQHRIDGVAMVSRLSGSPMIGEIAARGIPLVLLGRTYDDPSGVIGSVGSDLDGFIRQTIRRFKTEKVRRIRLYRRSRLPLAVDEEVIRALEAQLPGNMSFDLGDLDDFEAPGDEIDAVICRSMSSAAAEFLRRDRRPAAVWSSGRLRLPGVFRQYHDSFKIGTRGTELLLGMIEGGRTAEKIFIPGCDPEKSEPSNVTFQQDF
ncbi:MAG: LacI family DNA-binding transcriptional regulator [Lentisphaeria bacterium]|nr:LacI family DNA-binding transcriptional regulator [Lentisphaeria bacterium]